ncbi:MAG: acyltransferase [Candidatus Lokiarchaeota archaeon]|nr:acyltransferase [Candidatus Harpocratesius repetitus]
MKIGYIQFNPVFGEKETNFHTVEKITKGVKADLLVLPELFATGYTFNSKIEAEQMSEKQGEETTNFLQDLSSSTRAILVGGFIEKINNKIFNAALVVNEKQVIGIYEKVHLFYKEKLWFEPGNRGFQVWKFQNWNLGVMICFDWIFPESCRSLSLQGADIIAHPANLVLPYCQRSMITRSLENRVFTITANRFGKEHRGQDNFSFSGGSQITDPSGNVLISAEKNETKVDIVDIDPSVAHNKQMNEYNNLFKDRRNQYYFL